MKPGSRLTFEIEFHGPFRVGTGEAGPGVDATVHRQDLLPGSSLKGVMRSTARQLFGDVMDSRGQPLVDQVFGAPERRDGRDGRRAQWRAEKAESPWSWTGAVLASNDPDSLIKRRARVERGEKGTVVRHSLVIAEEVWPEETESHRTATFDVILRDRLDDAVRRRHELVLTTSALGTHALGAERRRGLGWVTIRRKDSSLGEADIAEIMNLRKGKAGAG